MISSTDRLTIRETTKEDVDLLLKMDKQEITQKYLGGVKNKSKEERISFLEKKENKLKNVLSYPFTVLLKDGTPLGFIELKLDGDKAELSYIFDFEHSNKGYCTEACKKIIDIAFNELDIKTIYAYSLDDNINSKRVLEKLDFKYIETVNRDDTSFLYYEKSIN